MSYRPVSRVEKLAEIDALGVEWPRCKCHDEPKFWSPTTTKPQGGSWRCGEKYRTKSLRSFTKNREKRYAARRAKNPEKRRAYRRNYHIENGEAERASSRRYYAKRKQTQTNINVLNDSLGRSICFPEVDRLWRGRQKVVALLERSTGGEKQAAEAAKNRLWTRLQEETSMILGGPEWLHSQTISAETRSTPPVTSSPLQLAA